MLSNCAQLKSTVSTIRLKDIEHLAWKLCATPRDSRGQPKKARHDKRSMSTKIKGTKRLNLPELDIATKK